VITVENTVSFLRPASGPDLICCVAVLRAGRNLVFVEAEVMVESILEFWSLFRVLSVPITLLTTLGPIRHFRIHPSQEY